MEFTGTYRIPAPRQVVWEALNDPGILQQAIPGCEEMKRVSDTEFEARVLAQVGPVKARFSGRVRLQDLNPPESYVLLGEGQGGAAGFARGQARVMLAEEDGVTMLRYVAEANVGGKLAQIGSRLIEGTARKMADQFFGRFSEIVAEKARAAGYVLAQAQPAEAAAQVAPAPSEAASPPPEPKAAPSPLPAPPAGLLQRPWVWVVGVVVVILILLWLLAP